MSNRRYSLNGERHNNTSCMESAETWIDYGNDSIRYYLTEFTDYYMEYYRQDYLLIVKVMIHSINSMIED